ncbi:SRC kinase signaling inhibitor 1 isoform X2 [Petromyzon marinus]|uniref:SRC kinase signaling inhibitor 1 isoform X2 n=1 Tax=Petromyzon marinus TaxID=7757 RepID=UPI003F71DE53
MSVARHSGMPSGGRQTQSRAGDRTSSGAAASSSAASAAAVSEGVVLRRPLLLSRDEVLSAAPRNGRERGGTRLERPVSRRHTVDGARLNDADAAVGHASGTPGPPRLTATVPHALRSGAPPRNHERGLYGSYRHLHSHTAPAPVSSTKGVMYPASPDMADYGAYPSAHSQEVTSEADGPRGFTRGSKQRASLPVIRSTNQSKDKPLGMLYLQYGGEMRQTVMPNSVTTMDTVRALFVKAFPTALTMALLTSPDAIVFVGDHKQSSFNQLNDIVGEVRDQAVLKLVFMEPAQAVYGAPRPSNGDMRDETLWRVTPAAANPGYASPALPSPSKRHSGYGPSPGPPGGTWEWGNAGPSGVGPGGRGSPSPAPRHHLQQPPPPASPVSPGAILERRDVRPDEDLRNRNVVLVRNEGLRSDPVLLGYYADAGGSVGSSARQSLASNASYTSEQQYQAAAARAVATGGYYEQGYARGTGSMRRSDSARDGGGGGVLAYASPGPARSRTPPASLHSLHGYTVVPIELDGGGRGSTVDGGRGPAAAAAASASLQRGTPTPSSTATTPPSGDSWGYGRWERSPSGNSTSTLASDRESREKMESMERKVTMLMELLQRTMGPEALEDALSRCGAEDARLRAAGIGGAGGGASATPAPACPTSNACTQTDSSEGDRDPDSLRSVAWRLKETVGQLRTDVNQLRHMQMSHKLAWQTVSLATARQVLGRATEAARRSAADHGDGAQARLQRQQLEESRGHFVGRQHAVQRQLSELEGGVQQLQRELSSTGGGDGGRAALAALDESVGALRHVGEGVSELQAQFSVLQMHLRSLLRAEVEAVKFLNDEPHQLEGLHRRCHVINEAIGLLRRAVAEGVPVSSLELPRWEREPVPAEGGPDATEPPGDAASPQPRAVPRHHKPAAEEGRNPAAGTAAATSAVATAVTATTVTLAMASPGSRNQEVTSAAPGGASKEGHPVSRVTRGVKSSRQQQQQQQQQEEQQEEPRTMPPHGGDRPDGRGRSAAKQHLEAAPRSRGAQHREGHPREGPPPPLPPTPKQHRDGGAAHVISSGAAVATTAATATATSTATLEIVNRSVTLDELERELEERRASRSHFSERDFNRVLNEAENTMALMSPVGDGRAPPAPWDQQGDDGQQQQQQQKQQQQKQQQQQARPREGLGTGPLQAQAREAPAAPAGAVAPAHAREEAAPEEPVAASAVSEARAAPPARARGTAPEVGGRPGAGPPATDDAVVTSPPESPGAPPRPPPPSAAPTAPSPSVAPEATSSGSPSATADGQEEEGDPPTPPPRGPQSFSFGLTTGRSGEVILTSRKESTKSPAPPTKSDAEANASAAEVSRLVPPTTPSSSLPPSVNRTPRPPVVASAFDSEDDEEEEEERILAELQAFQRSPAPVRLSANTVAMAAEACEVFDVGAEREVLTDSTSYLQQSYYVPYFYCTLTEPWDRAAAHLFIDEEGADACRGIGGGPGLPCSEDLRVISPTGEEMMVHSCKFTFPQVPGESQDDACTIVYYERSPELPGTAEVTGSGPHERPARPPSGSEQPEEGRKRRAHPSEGLAAAKRSVTFSPQIQTQMDEPAGRPLAEPRATAEDASAVPPASGGGTSAGNGAAREGAGAVVAALEPGFPQGPVGAGLPAGATRETFTQSSARDGQQSTVTVYQQSGVLDRGAQAPKTITIRYIEEITSETVPPGGGGGGGGGEEEGADGVVKEKLAFLIRESHVQAMSHEQAAQIVSGAGDEVTSLMVTNKAGPGAGAGHGGGGRDGADAATGGGGGSGAAAPGYAHGEAQTSETSQTTYHSKKQPIIVIFDEPMDIRAAYKRLSTIFEESDLDRMEQDWQSQGNSSPSQRNSTAEREAEFSDVEISPMPESAQEHAGGAAPWDDAEAARRGAARGGWGAGATAPTKGKHGAGDKDGKTASSSKFRIRFPRKQLAALTSALRSGTRSGKKTLELVPDGDERPDREQATQAPPPSAAAQGREAPGPEGDSSRAALVGSEQRGSRVVAKAASASAAVPPQGPQVGVAGDDDGGGGDGGDGGGGGSGKGEEEEGMSIERTEEIRQNTYRSLDSLEETIRELETTIKEISVPKTPPPVDDKAAAVAAAASPQQITEERPREEKLKTSVKKTSVKSKPPLLPKPSLSADQLLQGPPGTSPNAVTPVTPTGGGVGGGGHPSAHAPRDPGVPRQAGLADGAQQNGKSPADAGDPNAPLQGHKAIRVFHSFRHTGRTTSSSSSSSSSGSSGSGGGTSGSGGVGSQGQHK